MKPIVTIALLISLTACKIVSCPLAEKIANGASTAMAKAGDCQRPDLIKADVLTFLDRDKACSKPGQTGPIAMIACPILGRLVAEAAWKAVPAKWECNGGMAKSAIASVLTLGCNLIPF